MLDLYGHGVSGVTQWMRFRVEETQCQFLLGKQPAVVVLLKADERLVARVYRDAQGFQRGLTQRINQVLVLLAEAMAENTQGVFVPHQLRMAKVQLIRVTYVFTLVLTAVFSDLQCLIIYLVDVVFVL